MAKRGGGAVAGRQVDWQGGVGGWLVPVDPTTDLWNLGTLQLALLALVKVLSCRLSFHLTESQQQGRSRLHKAAGHR